jgi:beta-N-acetylhexosaminidase
MRDQLQADIGQLLWIGFEGTAVPADVAARIATGQAGAVILFARNIPKIDTADTGGEPKVDVEGLIELNRALHDAAPADGPPLWIAVDQEGGRVQRVRAPATVWPPMLSFDVDPRPSAAGREEFPEEEIEKLAERVGMALGRELALLGFDVDFAPVLDVHTNPQNPVIGDRAFGRDPARVAGRALAFARGLSRAGVIGCGKHFPGHGDTDTDSHLALPRLAHDMDRLRAVELLPFERAVAAGLPMIMTAHVVFAAMGDGLPATLSHRVITGLLRQEMGFGGVVVSDDLDMRAIADNFGVGEAAVAAIAAGCDALLLCKDEAHQHQAHEALTQAAENDSELRARVGEAAARIRAAKQRHAGARQALPSGLAAMAREHGRIARELVELNARAASGASDKQR